MDLKEQEILGAAIETHWYYRSKAAMLERLLPRGFNRKVLDVGAGSGYFSHHLARRDLIDAAVCVDTGYAADSDEVVDGVPVAYRRAPEPLDAGVALFMDVLEHVEDDAGLLTAYRDVLPAASTTIITVPAFNFLWSGHDIFLEHYRRYTVASLQDTIERAGYRVERLHYYYGLVFPLAFAVRLLARERMEVKSNMQVHGDWVNAALGAACRAELSVMKWNRLAGLSVCATCRAI